METSTRRTGSKREVYPVDLSNPDLRNLIRQAKRKTGIKNQAELLRLGLARGLPILIQQLGGSAGK